MLFPPFSTSFPAPLKVLHPNEPMLINAPTTNATTAFLNVLTFVSFHFGIHQQGPKSTIPTASFEADNKRRNKQDEKHETLGLGNSKHSGRNTAKSKNRSRQPQQGKTPTPDTTFHILRVAEHGPGSPSVLFRLRFRKTSCYASSSTGRQFVRRPGNRYNSGA